MFHFYIILKQTDFSSCRREHTTPHHTIPLSTFSIHATASNFNQGQNLGQKLRKKTEHHPPHQRLQYNKIY